MSEAKWRLQHLAIEMMTYVYQILLASIIPNYLCILANFDAIKEKVDACIRKICIIQIRSFLECSEGSQVAMLKSP